MNNFGITVHPEGNLHIHFPPPLVGTTETSLHTSPANWIRRRVVSTKRCRQGILLRFKSGSIWKLNELSRAARTFFPSRGPDPEKKSQLRWMQGRYLWWRNHNYRRHISRVYNFKYCAWVFGILRPFGRSHAFFGWIYFHATHMHALWHYIYYEILNLIFELRKIKSKIRERKLDLK